MKKIVLLAVIGLWAMLYIGCGDNVTSAGGGRDTLYISSHDTLYISSYDTIIVSSRDTVLVITHDTVTSYDTVTIYTYDTVRIYYGDTTSYTLTPSATFGGTISPSVPVRVDYGNLQLFIITPNSFYRLDSVTADSVRLTVLDFPMRYSVYVLNVSKSMEIKAWFSLSQFYYGMKLIPAGIFLMGADSVSQTAGTVNDSGDTIHQVTLSAFYMDTTEVTQGEYYRLMGLNPSNFIDTLTGSGILLPVEKVTWFDAVLYCNARSKSEGKDTVYSYSVIYGTPGDSCTGLFDLAIDYTKKGYRLPTEAEWEYACRGGTTTIYWWGADTNGIGVRAWSNYNSTGTTHPVGTKLANAYGLYDITGNVWEWCNDWYGSYNASAVTNPTGATTGMWRVVRGGSWYNDVIVDYFRSACHIGNLPYIRFGVGFRCVLPQ